MLKKVILGAADRIGYEITHKKAAPPPYMPPRIVSYGPVPETSDLSSVRGLFEQRQCVVLRKAIDPDWVKDYRRICERYLADLDGLVALGAAHPHTKIFNVQNTMSMEAARDERLHAPAGWQNIIYRIKDSGLLDIGAQIYGQPCALLLQRSSMKRQIPFEPQKGLAFHQDSAVITGNKIPLPGLVLWVPVTPLDDDTPGLEIITEPAYRVGEFHINPKNGFLETDENDETIRGTVAPVPDMNEGDILIFSLMVPHRTRVLPGMSKTRISFDIRVVPLSAVPADYTGLKIL